MPKSITVTNLKTGEELVYTDTIPSEAVVFAYLYSTGNHNTWEYEALYSRYYSKLTWGKNTVALYDFCAPTVH
jgi:hypothetical protein